MFCATPPVNSNRPPLAPLAGTSGSISEDRYRHDLALHDRFQGFGAELLRIALLGLGAFGFILVTETEKQTIATRIVGECLPLKILVALSPVCFGLSAAFSLMHRFQASDGMFHHFRAIKLIDLQGADLAGKIASEEAARNAKFKSAEANLLRSGWTLGLGAALLAASFVWIVLLMP